MEIGNWGTNELRDQVLTTAECITDPAYASDLKTARSWQVLATGLARLVIELDSALLGGGEIPFEWVIGDLIEESPDEDNYL